MYGLNNLRHKLRKISCVLKSEKNLKALALKLNHNFWHFLQLILQDMLRPHLVRKIIYSAAQITGVYSRLGLAPIKYNQNVQRYKDRTRMCHVDGLSLYCTQMWYWSLLGGPQIQLCLFPRILRLSSTWWAFGHCSIVKRICNICTYCWINVLMVVNDYASAARVQTFRSNNIKCESTYWL